MKIFIHSMADMQETYVFNEIFQLFNKKILPIIMFVLSWFCIKKFLPTFFKIIAKHLNI